MKRMTGWAAIFWLGLALAACEPEKKIEEGSAEFEAWLQQQGMTPLGAGEATELLSDATLYGRYGGAEGRWVEYYSKGGVSVFQPDADQNPKRRLVYIGTWWAEPDRTCFSYPERKLDCYRVYSGKAGIYFIRIEGGADRPPGSLAVMADAIRAGNTENYPFVAN